MNDYPRERYGITISNMNPRGTKYDPTRCAYEVAGGWRYHQCTRPSGQPFPIATDAARWAVGAVVGATVRHGPWTLALRYYADSKGFPGHAGNWPPLWSGQTAITLNYRFGGKS